MKLRFIKKPLDRVSYGGIIHWIIPPIFLISVRQKDFELCGARPKALPLETTNFLKKVGSKTLLVVLLVSAERFTPLRSKAYGRYQGLCRRLA